MDICYDEMDKLKEDLENNCFAEVKYLDTWDYEDDYSHKYIKENRKMFVDMANEYFRIKGMPLLMREVCENAMVCKPNGEIIKIK